MPLSAETAAEIDGRLAVWRQGDVALQEGLEFGHFADLSQAHSEASGRLVNDMTQRGEPIDGSFNVVFETVQGLAVLTQTCDIVRSCVHRPFIEVAPLVEAEGDAIEGIRKQKFPSLAYIPGVADRGLVADLDRTMTVEKAVVAYWARIEGCRSDEEVRKFAQALSRKRSRFAFPDAFTAAADRLKSRFAAKHERDSEEGKFLRSLSEIRVRATPSWDAEEITLEWWFLKDSEPVGVENTWDGWKAAWLALFECGDQFTIAAATICSLADMSAYEYDDSDPFDFDSVSRT